MQRKGATIVSALLTAMAIVATGSGAHAAPPVAVAESTHVTAAAGTQVPEKYDEMMSRLAAIEPGTDVATTAAKLFPDQPSSARDYMDVANRVDGPAGEGAHALALPAALAPFVAAVGFCVADAIGGVGVNELITLVHQGKQASAEARVYSAVGGCITSVVPPLLRPLAKKAQKPLAEAALWVTLKMGPKA